MHRVAARVRFATSPTRGSCSGFLHASGTCQEPPAEPNQATLGCTTHMGMHRIISSASTTIGELATTWAATKRAREW